MSNPYLIATGGAATGAGTTLVVNVATASAANDVIFVAASTSGIAGTISGVVDSKGNTYAQINSDLTQIPTYQFETTGATAALTTSDTITITYSSTSGTKEAVIVGIPGVSSGHDGPATPSTVNSAGATSSSITSNTLSQANEVVMVVLSVGAQATGPTWGAGLTSAGVERQGSNQWLTVAYEVVSSTSAVTATATWPTSVKYCTLLSTFKVPTTPPPTGLYLVGQASSASGSATLSVPITSATSPGDTVTVGVLASAGSVLSVTDTAGNSYSLQRSDTAITGAQIYVFEAYNTTALVPGSGSPGSLVGATTSTGQYPGVLADTRDHAATTYDTYVGHPMAHSAEKVYYQNTVQGGGGLGKYPVPTSGHFVDGNGSDITPLVTAGCDMLLCYQPYIGTNAATIASELTAFEASVQAWISLHPNGADGVQVIIYQEPQNSAWAFNTGTDAQNAAAYIAVVRNYAGGIRSLTDGSGKSPRVIYDAAGHAPPLWITYYPGNAFIDQIGVDFYGHNYAQQVISNPDPLQVLRNLALTNNKPFSVLEMGSAIVPSTATNAQVLAYLSYLTTMMSAIPANLRGPMIWYNANRNVSNINTIGYDYTTGTYIGAADYRIGPLGTLWNTLTTPTPSSITVTYSGTASAQAAIAVGDNGVVTTGRDIAVGATGTSTTPTVATGTLAQAEEHIIAFFASLNAGGSAVLGDGLTAASTGLVAGVGGPRLKAGFKSVNTTATDSPSATITSTSWAISAITHALPVPVITNAPGAGIVGQAFSWTGTSTGGTGALTWSSTGVLPTGLSFSSAGVLSGTPTTAGSFNYGIIVTDASGLQGTITVTQEIVALGGGGGAGPAPLTPLQNNILSLADASSESSTGYTWASFQNAATPSRVTLLAVDGTHATEWTALAAGDTQIATGLYTVQGGLPYIFSTFLYTNQNLLANVGVAWFDNTGTLIASVNQGNSFGTVSGGWTPLTFATVSPGNAVSAALVVTGHGASAGQVFLLDLAYMTQSPMQILVDWVNPTFTPGGSAGQLFMDVSPFVRYDQNVSYTRGRQDAISQVQAGSASFILQNDLGSFMASSTTSIPAATGGAVSLQRRCQINSVDESGQWWTRFDGSIAQIDYAFDNSGNTSMAMVTLTDVLSGLSRQDQLFCWTKEQVLADKPIYHWSLDDPGNTGGTGPAGAGPFGTAAETSGSNGPPMRLLNTDSTKVATIQWQDTSGGIETLADAVGASLPDGSEFWSPGSNQPSNSLRGLDSGTVGPFTTPRGSVYLTPVTTALASQNQFIGNNGYYLQSELPATLPTNDAAISYAFECWFTMDPSIATTLASHFGPYIPLSFGSSRQKACIVAGLFLNAGSLQFKAANYNQPPAFLGLNWSGVAPPAALSSTTTAMGADVVKRPHHLVINVLGDPVAPMAYAYLDGIAVGSFALLAGQVFDTVTAGAAYGGAGAHFGHVQLVSVYPQSLSQQQIIMHSQLGQYGMWESTADDVIAQIAGFAHVPAFWMNISAAHNGLTLMEYFDITGTNALGELQIVAQAENGLLYVDASGALNFHTRDWRAGYGAPDLILPPGTFDADMSFQLIDQFMTNEMAVAGPGTTGATSGQPQTDQTASANVQAGFINTASQNQYGVYSSNPVSSPLSLPLITWSRAYAQLGLPSLTYWPDPNLLDLAAWNANSRGDPALFPAALAIDLLTLDAQIPDVDPDGNPIVRRMGISDFYGLEIDNMVVPSGTLPVNLPNATGAMEWFIEGISEVMTLTKRTLTLYVSPARTQRAWVPGDAVYGILGSTTRLGISQSDLSTPQADGKDVSHDAGPPYWPPVFSNTMNNPDGSGNVFVGSAEMRGIVSSLQLALQPPMCSVTAISQTQNFNNGSLSNPALSWDTINVDTTGGMGLIPGYPQWYVCTVPGFYELSGSVVWSLTGAGLAGYTGQAWFAVAQGAAQQLASGTGTPTTTGAYVNPTGSAQRFNASTMNPVNTLSTRMYLGLGDMVALCGEQNFTSSRGTSTSPIGSQMSVRFVGLATADDRTQINSLISSGGTVTLVTGPTPGSFTYVNTHTYSYQGKTGASAYSRRNTDGAAFQCLKGSSDFEGSQTSQIVFNAALIASQLAGKTITSATLTCQNSTAWYKTGTKLMLGTTTVTPGGTSFHPTASNSNVNIMHQKFDVGQQLSFAIPVSMVQAIASGGSTALMLGDSVFTNLEYFGSWNGGPGSWTLKVTYK
jgi:hypothetical protein